MKNHVFRPLFVVIALVAVILIARAIIVPDDFGIGEAGYMYGWHRKSNEDEWKRFKVKYKEKDYCQQCHPDKHDLISQTPHANISCQNCHGPAMGHPVDPPKLSIDRGRQQCLRCHAMLPYKGSGRIWIRMVEDSDHNPTMQCVTCHNPHKPGFS